MFDSVIWVNCKFDSIVLVDCNTVSLIYGIRQKSLFRVMMAVPFDGSEFPRPRVHEPFSVSAASPAFSEVQVNLSWWLAVWSQEVASARGVTMRRRQWRN